VDTKIFTDGSSLGNPGPGGFCAIIETKDGNHVAKGGEIDTTNNRMEMAGIIAGLNFLRKNMPQIAECAIYSDSSLIIQSMKEGWKRKKNKDLWEQIDKLIVQFKKIDWNWIRGHAGHPQNTKADKIAVEEAEKQQKLARTGKTPAHKTSIAKKTTTQDPLQMSLI
jgi:ribonuclease HI